MNQLRLPEETSAYRRDALSSPQIFAGIQALSRCSMSAFGSYPHPKTDLICLFRRFLGLDLSSLGPCQLDQSNDTSGCPPNPRGQPLSACSRNHQPPTTGYRLRICMAISAGAVGNSPTFFHTQHSVESKHAYSEKGKSLKESQMSPSGRLRVSKFSSKRGFHSSTAPAAFDRA